MGACGVRRESGENQGTLRTKNHISYYATKHHKHDPIPLLPMGLDQVIKFINNPICNGYWITQSYGLVVFLNGFPN